MEKEKSISILRTGHSQFPHLLPWPGLKRAACGGEHSCLLTWQCCGPASLHAGRAPTGLSGQGASRGVGAGGTGWCRAPHTLQAREGWRPHSAGVRAWSLPHHTRGSRPGPAAPAEAMKGAELPALHLGFLRDTKGSGKLEVPHCCWEKEEQPSASTSPHGSPLLMVVRG